MTNLIAALAWFTFAHLGPSLLGFRGAVANPLGRGAYAGLFSLVSAASLIWVIVAYGEARGDPGEIWWTAGEATRWVQAILQALALFLIVPGLLTPNPTSVAQEGVASKPDAVHGMLRITRHPFLWGVAIWAAGHLLVNGDAPSLALFGTMLGLAVFGTISIDAKRRRSLGATWDGFAARTSSVPFAAILAGRQNLALGEIGWWRIALGVLVYALLLGGHPHLFGVAALP